MKNLLLCGSLGAALACWVGAAGAHGDWPPKHDGLMSVGGEITMEMVRDTQRTMIYVEDHGEQVALDGSQATLDVKRGDGRKERVELRVLGGNRLETGPLDFAPGDRAMVVVRFDSGILMHAQFIWRFR